MLYSGFALQLQAIRAERGASANDGSEVALKPLVEVLREAKEAKEEAFQAVWRSMKTGDPAASSAPCISSAPCLSILIRFGPRPDAYRCDRAAGVRRPQHFELHLHLQP